MSNILNSRLSPVEFVEESTPAFVWRCMKQYENNRALVDAETEESYTFGELRVAAENLASHLLTLGLRAGHTITFFSSNCLEYCVCLIAAWRLGAIPALLNAMSTAKDVRRELGTIKSSILFVNQRSAGAGIIGSKGTTVKHILCAGSHPGCLSIAPLMTVSSGKPLPSIESLNINPKEDLFGILFSSGTTGVPKAVQLTHYNFTTELSLLGHPDLEFPRNGYVIFQPMAHIYGVGMMLFCLGRGATLYLMPGFSMELLLKTVEKNKLTEMSLVPPITVMLAKSGLLKKYDLSSVRSVMNGAAPLSLEAEIDFKNQLGGKVFMKQAYGLTETTGGVVGYPGSRYTGPGPKEQGSIGILLPGHQAKIVNPETGKTLGANEKGELCFRGPLIMKGYKDNPKATAETILPEGWLHTGDIGYYDENGYFYIVDRLKELIKYNALQVSPSELENMLLGHPAISDVGVTGRPDTVAGELPMAWVVLKPGHTASAKDIQDYVAKNAAPYKRLRGGVTFVDAIPKSPSGKILRKVIKEAVVKESMKSKL